MSRPPRQLVPDVGAGDGQLGSRSWHTLCGGLGQSWGLGQAKSSDDPWIVGCIELHWCRKTGLMANLRNGCCPPQLLMPLPILPW